VGIVIPAYAGIQTGTHADTLTEVQRAAS